MKSPRLCGMLSAFCLIALAAPVQAAHSVQSLLDAGNHCNHLNTGTAAPAGWAAPGFQASGWGSGAMPMGHAETVATDIGKPGRTAYFRCAFAVNDPAAVVAGTVRLRLDDGAVAYLNGQRLASINMPAGTVSHDTPALLDNYDGTRWQSVVLPVGQLRAGQNVLAVELHQNFTLKPAWISGDATFDARVEATVSDAPPAGWRLHHAEEFNGTAVDAARWKVYHNTYGDGDPFMLQCQTPGNVAVGNGSLTLTARRQTVACPKSGRTVAKEYTSGFLGSRDVGRYYPLYGRYEARIRVPHGQGLFPAFWLRHRNGASMAEVDIMEVFHSSRPGQVTQTVHLPHNIGYNVAQKGRWTEAAMKGRGGWHVYSVDILPVVRGDPTRVRFVMRIDGVTHYEYIYDYNRARQRKNASNWVTSADPMASWDIALQLWVGGRWTGHPDRTLGFYPTGNNGNPGQCAQTGKAPPNGPDSCPKNGIWLAPWNDAAIEFDYVRVYVPN